MEIITYKKFYIVKHNTEKIDMVNRETGKWRTVKSKQAGTWRSTHYQTKLNRVSFWTFGD